jgi:hypothetical protein
MRFNIHYTVSLLILALAIGGLAATAGPALVAVEATSNPAPPGCVAVTGIAAGAFNPAIWQSNTLHFLPDFRSPLLEPLEGKWRNIYAPSAVELPDGYRVFYGAWDGVPTGNDRIYSLWTDRRFQTFSGRHSVLLPGTYTHVCNVNAFGREDGRLALCSTVYPVASLNKPAFFVSDATGTNWNGRPEPCTVSTGDLVTMTGYDYPNADINGMNVLLVEDGGYRLYFADFKNFTGVFRATSTNGHDYRFDAKVLDGAAAPNDVKKFRVSGVDHYLMGLHGNGDRLWFSLSTDGRHFPAKSALLSNLGAEDRYIVALGWVVSGEPRDPKRRLLGVLYGAGAAPSLDKNRIFARWLQKRVVFVAESGAPCAGAHSLGPDCQLLRLDSEAPVRGTFEVYAEDGRTLLGVSRATEVAPGREYRVRVASAADK